jgi:hypothetical protein
VLQIATHQSLDQALCHMLSRIGQHLTILHAEFVGGNFPPSAKLVRSASRCPPNVRAPPPSPLSLARRPPPLMTSLYCACHHPDRETRKRSSISQWHPSAAHSRQYTSESSRGSVAETLGACPQSRWQWPGCKQPTRPVEKDAGSADALRLTKSKEHKHLGHKGTETQYLPVGEDGLAEVNVAHAKAPHDEASAKERQQESNKGDHSSSDLDISIVTGKHAFYHVDGRRYGSGLGVWITTPNAFLIDYTFVWDLHRILPRSTIFLPQYEPRMARAGGDRAARGGGRHPLMRLRSG